MKIVLETPNRLKKRKPRRFKSGLGAGERQGRFKSEPWVGKGWVRCYLKAGTHSQAVLKQDFRRGEGKDVLNQSLGEGWVHCRWKAGTHGGEVNLDYWKAGLTGEQKLLESRCKCRRQGRFKSEPPAVRLLPLQSRDCRSIESARYIYRPSVWKSN